MDTCHTPPSFFAQFLNGLRDWDWFGKVLIANAVMLFLSLLEYLEYFDVMFEEGMMKAVVAFVSLYLLSAWLEYRYRQRFDWRVMAALFAAGVVITLFFIVPDKEIIFPSELDLPPLHYAFFVTVSAFVGWLVLDGVLTPASEAYSEDEKSAAAGLLNFLWVLLVLYVIVDAIGIVDLFLP